MTDQTTIAPISLSLSVVCYHTSPVELETLLDSIYAAVSYAKKALSLNRVHITIIDNSETDGLNESYINQLEVKPNSTGIDLVLVHGHGNVGYGRAHNMALMDLQSDFHLVLNPDVVLEEDCLSEGLGYLLNQPDAVLASPFATNNLREKQYLCKRYPSVLTLLVRGFLPTSWQQTYEDRLAHYEMRDLSELTPTMPVPIASGCFMLCRSDVLREVGGFDERFFLYFEDFDLSLRLGQFGQLAYLPSMKICHTGGYAAKKGLKHIAMFVRSGIRFFNTHGWRWF